MEKEQEPPAKEPAPVEAVPEAPARDDVHVEGASRCPFCREGVAPSASDWVACRSCLARHHVACWGEHGACSACGEGKFLPATPGRARAAGRRRLLALGVGLLVAVGLAASRSARRGDGPQRVVTPGAVVPDLGRTMKRLVPDAFTRLESYTLQAVNPATGKVWDESQELYLDEYAELLARMVNEGYSALTQPEVGTAKTVISQVVEELRRRGMERGMSPDVEQRYERLERALDTLKMANRR